MAKRQLSVFSLSAIDLLCSSFGAMFVLAFIMSTVPTKESESTNRATIVSFSTEATGSTRVEISAAYTGLSSRVLSGETDRDSVVRIAPDMFDGTTFSILLPESGNPDDRVYVFAADLDPAERQVWQRKEIRVLGRRIGVGRTESEVLVLKPASGYIGCFSAARLTEPHGFNAPLGPEAAGALAEHRRRGLVANPLATALALHESAIRSRSVEVQTAKGDGPALAESLARVGRGIYQSAAGKRTRIEVLEASPAFPGVPHQLAITDLSRRHGGLMETVQIVDFPQSSITNGLMANILPTPETVRLGSRLPLIDMLAGLANGSPPGVPRVLVGTRNKSALLLVSNAPWLGAAAVLTPEMDRSVSSPVLIEPDLGEIRPTAVQSVIDRLDQDMKRSLLAVGSKGFAIQEGSQVRFVWTDIAAGESVALLGDVASVPDWARGAETPTGFTAEQWLMALVVTSPEYRRRIEGVLVDPALWCTFEDAK